MNSLIHLKPKQFDVINFSNGHKKDSPKMTVKCKGISIDKGKEEWGAEKNKYYFLIKLGEIINTNLK